MELLNEQQTNTFKRLLICIIFNWHISHVYLFMFLLLMFSKIYEIDLIQILTNLINEWESAIG